MALSETRKADRQIMADRLVTAMLAAGAVEALAAPHTYEPNRIDVDIKAPGGATITVDFDGKSCQPNVHVATWQARGMLFLSPLLGDVNPYHFHKLSVVGYGLEDMISKLSRHLARFADGSGYLSTASPQIVAMAARYKAQGWTWPLESRL